MAVAILTFLTFVSPNQGRVTAGWLHLLRQGFGWGAFVTPFGLGIAGVWLLMGGFGRSPSIGLEKVIGVLLIFVMLLGLTHLVTETATPWTLVVEGRAGGLLGWVVGQGLQYSLGRISAFVIVIAMLIIGILMVVGRSTSEIGMMLWQGWAQLKGRIQERQRARPARLTQRPDFVINNRSSVTSPAEQEPISEAPNAPLKQEPAITVSQPRLEPQPEPEPEFSALMSQSTQAKSANVNWKLPKLSALLEDLSDQEISQAEIEQRVSIIERTLESFGVPARVVEVNQGPAITQFGVEPGFTVGRGGKQTKVKVSKIAALADDLSLALAAAPIRIEAPVPGRSIVGVEVPNQEVAMVSLRGVMETQVFDKVNHKTQLPIALGEDVSGSPVVADLIAMPHLLIAGATGSGKSVCINAIIAAFLCTNTPDDLQMVMIDPKRVELTGYNGIPHLLAPVVVDLERVVGTLRWVTREMDRRYKQFSKVGARNIQDFNRRVVAGGQGKLPYIVVIIDELADLMMVAPDEVERLICRIAQMARATGIHLVIATQRPSVDVVTGLIKANFPARVSFMVTSSVDSRVIIDTTGAERLLGSGDMLFMSPSSSQVLRLQGCFVSPAELDRLIGYWKDAAEQSGETPSPRKRLVQGALPTLQQMQEPEPEPLPGQEDEMVDKAIDVIRQEGRASITLLQRRLRIGYARAARIIVALEDQGIIGPDQGGSRGREVFMPQN
ncbi:MAG: DNA translocase FtsK 4TM domain-containing protein [Anaerolineae bacterium]|nr:DNA translocase FtsK 4TM domain-containing protein [Anaerolineae bacterium]